MKCSNCTKADATGVLKLNNVYFVLCDACSLFMAQRMQEDGE